jgi:hypothetical protein
MQAVLFYSEQVMVRATAVTRPGDKTVYRRVNELADMGLLSTWAYEYELSSSGRPVRQGQGPLIRDCAPAQVVTVETSRDLVNIVDDELSRDRRRPYDGLTLREGISEVVQLRHAITALRMTDHLGAQGIVGGSTGQSALVSQVQHATASVDAAEAVVSEVVSRCSFGPLSDLPGTAIEDCRRVMPRFRHYLEDRLTGQSHGQPEDPGQVAELILSEYRRISGINKRESRRPAVADSWDVVGMVLPHAVVVKAMGTKIEWFRYRGTRRRPFILLGKLQHHAQEAHP